MRKIAITVAALLFPVFGSFAGVITDPFNQSQAGCVYTLTAPFSNCDVVGNPAFFDIQQASVTVSPTLVDTVLYFNYGGGISLSPFGSPLVKLPGDLFFYDPADPLTSAYDPSMAYPEYKFGVPLVNHNGLTAGDLYKIVNFNALQTAQQVLDPTNQNPTIDYRRTQPVWMPANETFVATGNETISNYGDGVTNAQYAVEIKIPNPSAAFLALVAGGQIGIGFESATCANDIVVGSVNVAPEPGSFVLLAAGIGLLGLGVWRRRRLN
jgi:hypothetical protein